MSKKRKKPGQQRGGRYTPPSSRPTQSVRPAGLASGEPASPDPDWGDADDEAGDDRWPVTITLPRFGNRTVPQAFADWVTAEGLLEQFDVLMCDRHERGAGGDPLQAFVNGRDDVPPAVTEAIAGFDDYLDQLFGPPVE